MELAASIGFRPLCREDFGDLARWLEAPHVARWYGDEGGSDASRLEAKYGPRIDGADPVEVFVVELDGRPIGFVQWCPGDRYAWWPTELGYADAVAIDGLIGEADIVGKGIGSAIVKAFVPLIDARFPAARGVVGSPRRTNAASCRTLENAAFVCVYEGDFPSDGQVDHRVYFRTRTR